MVPKLLVFQNISVPFFLQEKYENNEKVEEGFLWNCFEFLFLKNRLCHGFSHENASLKNNFSNDMLQQIGRRSQLQNCWQLLLMPRAKLQNSLLLGSLDQEIKEIDGCPS